MNEGRKPLDETHAAAWQEGYDDGVKAAGEHFLPALQECAEVITFALGEAKLTPDENAALAAGLSYDSTVLALKLTHALSSARAALSPPAAHAGTPTYGCGKYGPVIGLRCNEHRDGKHRSMVYETVKTDRAAEEWPLDEADAHAGTEREGRDS